MSDSIKEFKWEVKLEDWMIPGYPASFRYRILSGGPTFNGWISRIEITSETSSMCLILNSKDGAEFTKKLLSWIKTWWDPKQRQH